MHTTESNKRQQLINNLQHECAVVQQSIVLLTNCRKKIEENAAQVKSRIVNDATNVLECVRSREVQLLRQVDVIENHHLNLVQVQYAKLHQLLGNLRHTLYCAEHQENVPVNSSLDDMDLVFATCHHKFTKDPITFCSDMGEIMTAIQKFGAVASTKNILAEDAVLSESLPSSIVEYEDGDHQLLYKTLEELNIDGDTNLKVANLVPKLSNNKDDWLRKVNFSDSNDQSLCKPRILLPADFIASDNRIWLKGIPCHGSMSREFSCTELDVQNWLRQVDRHSSCISESIEMISYADTVDTNDSSWLVEPVAVNPSFSVESSWLHSRSQSKNKENHESSKSAGCVTAMDIENLGHVSCTSSGLSTTCFPSDGTDVWLARGRQPKLSELEDLRISDVCCANELCQSFSDCVCDISCRTRGALERQGSGDKNCRLKKKHGAGYFSPLATDVKWLKSPVALKTDGDDASEKQWLKYNFLSDTEKMDASEKQFFNMWSNRSSAGHWLKRFLSTNENASGCCKIREDFQMYFNEPGNVQDWLC